MNNHALNAFVAKHITRTPTPAVASSAKGLKRSTSKPPAKGKAPAADATSSGIGPVFPNIAQPQPKIAAPVVGPKGPTGKVKQSKKGNTMHIHIHLPGKP